MIIPSKSAFIFMAFLMLISPEHSFAFRERRYINNPSTPPKDGKERYDANYDWSGVMKKIDGLQKPRFGRK
ncbi:hypothetical protein ANCCAN_00688 [Ancylostoma caninum]|uniref:Uncharacterized protein n=1 Tax=Ancylostoma caninum TaxID=29170 RepID=A0A368HD32_ANCCA|nr:hypothetical protein ANCCAN_00688 [Ancylostoma caninum]